MHKEAQEELMVRLKLVVLELTSHLGVTKACQELNVPHSILLPLETEIRESRSSWIVSRKTGRLSPSQQDLADAVEKIPAIRVEHQFGALRIMYYLNRYHGIKVLESTMSRVLKAHGLRRLPKTVPRRALHTQR